MAAMILCVLVMLALCVLKLVKRTDYRRESDYFYENNLDEYGENEAYTSEYIDYSKAYQPKWLFSYNEKAFYHKLKTFADRNGLFLFAKVRLLDLVEPLSIRFRQSTLISSFVMQSLLQDGSSNLTTQATGAQIVRKEIPLLMKS